jgi:hypothetical protein
VELRKTTILPTDDPALARRMFTHAVFDEVEILLVALGTGEEIERLVARADKLAGKPEDLRWVIWARQPSDLAVEIANLKGEKVDLEKARAFSLSLTDTVRDVISTAEPEPDLVRIFEAYAEAEAEE